MVSVSKSQMNPASKARKFSLVGDIPLSMFRPRKEELTWWQSWLLSLGFHGLVIGLILLTFLILIFFGISLMEFQRPDRPHDIEFHLVTAPEQKPKDPNTRNRADRNTRAGGEKIPNVKEAESQKKAGTAKPQVQPQPAPQPKPKKQVKPRVTKPKVSKPNKQPKKTPKKVVKPKAPRPKITKKPTRTTAPRVAAVPNPLAPIKVPTKPAPTVNTGPIVPDTPTSSGGSASGSSASSPAPATVPGQFANLGGARGGAPGVRGDGGRGAMTQYGSPGGGRGPAGIDAMVEPDFGPYLAELQRRIRRNWHPPEDREDKTVVLIFTIARDGRLLDVRTKRSSGYQNADGAARLAIERSAPFRPLPPEYRKSSINVEFTFDYNVFKGRSGGISRR